MGRELQGICTVPVPCSLRHKLIVLVPRKACETGVWTNNDDGSQVVNTAWACIGLLIAEYPERGPVETALRLIMKRQQRNGEWLQERIEGVFNKSWWVLHFAR